MADKLRMASADIVDENIEFIASRWPNAVMEVEIDGKLSRRVDFDVLKQELSKELISDKQERYVMTWPDKKKALLSSNAGTNCTFRPDIDKSINFHNTKNIYIEGDNLNSLKILRETYLDKIKLIYIDPPYNTGNDFIYNDNFSDSIENFLSKSGQVDDESNKMVANTETNGRFHSDWLNMIYPRLKIARDLLSEDGFILISIDDHEVDNLSKVMAEIFGDNNVIGKFVVNSTPNGRDYGHMGKMHEYVILCSKNNFSATSSMLLDEERSFKYTDSKGGFNIHPLYNSNVAFTPSNRPNLFYPFYVNTKSKNGDFYEISLLNHDGWEAVYPPKSVKDKVQFVWRWGKQKSEDNLNTEIVGYCTNGEFRIVEKMRHTKKIIRSILSGSQYTSRKGTAEVESIFGEKTFSFPKPVQLLIDFIQAYSNDDSIIMDFFSGSGTFAEATIQANAIDNGQRSFILIQMPESIEHSKFNNICDIGEERIKRAGKIIKEKSGLFANDIDIGFRVFKLDSSNMKDVYYNPSLASQSLLEQEVDNVKDDRTPLDLLFQVMLEMGIELSAHIDEKEVNGKKFYVVNDSDLVACFDEDINDDIVKAIAKIKPIYAVFRDSSFNNDSSNINCEQLFKVISPATEIKVI